MNVPLLWRDPLMLIAVNWFREDVLNTIYIKLRATESPNHGFTDARKRNLRFKDSAVAGRANAGSATKPCLKLFLNKWLGRRDSKERGGEAATYLPTHDGPTSQNFVGKNYSWKFFELRNEYGCLCARYPVCLKLPGAPRGALNMVK